ncbi:MAG: Cytosolic iron-sulfur protein assembly protein [Piccolia ochrophora]|nr:MAG: Cytosolic iron-sulfur protein assembly protein [Piccolia ochrophora]
MATPTNQLTLLSALSPPSTTRAWMAAPHPHLPIVACATSAKTVIIYSLATFTKHSVISGGHKRSVRSCAWQPSSAKSPTTVLATGSFDASAGIWRRDEQYGDGGANSDNDADDDWHFSVVLDGHDSEVKCVAWSASGMLLATCGRDKSIWIWEDTGEVGNDNFETIAVLTEHEGDVKCVAWAEERDVLASASYDNDIRLWKEDIDGEYVCICVMRGHEGTVWALAWEGVREEGRRERIVSCSDDATVRIWRNADREGEGSNEKRTVPSTFRAAGEGEETWVQESALPQRHERGVYSVAWSKKTGRILSTGGDGKVVIYEERPVASTNGVENDVNGQNGPDGTVEGEVDEDASRRKMEWFVYAEYEAAHGVYEVNHACWSRRYDKGRKSEDEEFVITTGDDGTVNTWLVGEG